MHGGTNAMGAGMRRNGDVQGRTNAMGAGMRRNGDVQGEGETGRSRSWPGPRTNAMGAGVRRNGDVQGSTNAAGAGMRRSSLARTPPTHHRVIASFEHRFFR